MQIPLVERDVAPALVLRVVDGLERSGRAIGDFHKMLANKPDVLRAYLQLCGAVMAEGAVPLRLKELAYLRSILNGCAY